MLAPEHSRGGAIGAVRFAFRALSAISPALTVRVAERLWFTPPRPQFSAATRAVLESGTRVDARVNGRHVAAWSWGAGPAVLLMHGWGGAGAQMGGFVEPLVQAGFRAITFDAPAHGASGASRFGKRQSSFFDFADALTEIGQMAGDVAGVIAHSGGCTATAWAIRNGWRVPAAVFIAPMGSPIAYQSMFQRALGVSDAVMRRFSARVEEKLAFRWSDLEMTTVPRVAETPRTLVVHDRDDNETPWHEGASVAETWPNATLRTTEGLGHRRVLRDAKVVAEVVGFLT